MDTLVLLILLSPILIFILLFIYEDYQSRRMEREILKNNIGITLRSLLYEGFVSESFYNDVYLATVLGGYSIDWLSDIDQMLRNLYTTCKREETARKTPTNKVSKVAQKLGLCNSFTNSELKKAYRAWMNVNHPDKNHNANLDEVQQVTAWYNERKSK